MKDIKTFDEHLNEQYGKIGTEKRTNFEIKAKAFAIGEILREARKEAKMTQEELARKTGTRKSFISRIENGHSDIQLSTLYRLVEIGFGKKVNLSIGYERGGFSARISMLYQGSSLFADAEPDMGRLATSVGTTPEKDVYVGKSTRWDLVVKQNIKAFQVFLYVNNFTNVKENTFLAGSVNSLVTSSFVYGMTIDLGVNYKF